VLRYLFGTEQLHDINGYYELGCRFAELGLYTNTNVGALLNTSVNAEYRTRR
jgi:hypothetical protein